MAWSAWTATLLILVVGLITVLKFGEIWYHTGWTFLHGRACALDLANAIKRWKRSGFSKEQRASEYVQLLNKYAPLLSFESWIITSWFVVPRVSPKVTTRVFWVPSIVLYWSVIEILSSSEHRFELEIGIVSLCATIWSYVAQMLLMRLNVGGVEYFFRHMSKSRDTMALDDWLAPKHELLKEYLIVLSGIIMCIFVGYASIYVGIEKLWPASFTGSPLDFHSALYFSVVIFATVGFGDIAPLTTFARYMVMSEIGLSFVIIVLIIMLVSATSSFDTEEG